jgi:membrane associated rhomboid family serine protease
MSALPEPTTCYRHPDRVTGRHCTRCGRPACPECLRDASVGAQCVDCVRASAPTTSQRLRTLTRAQDLVATKSIMAITIGVFIFTGLHDGTIDGQGALSRDLWLFGPSVHNGEWYRMFTASLVHFGFVHIFFNMLLLWIVGQMLEPGTGSLRFATIYVVSVLAGSAAALLMQPHIPSGGASGGIFGIAAAATLVMQRRGVRFWDTGLGPLIVINLFLDYFVLTNVSIAAHVGGIIGGVLVTEGMIQARRQNQVWVGWAVAIFVGVTSLLLGIAVSGR